MIPAKLRAQFATVCRLTALGGSEKGTCTCVSPPACLMVSDPHFAEAREQAKDRMARHFENCLRDEAG